MAGSADAAARSTEVAPTRRRRWWQRHRPQFEVHYWDDGATHDAIDRAAAAAAVSGHIWVGEVSGHRKLRGLHLGPGPGFTVSLFELAEAVTGVDYGTLYVDVAPDEVSFAPVNDHMRVRGPLRRWRYGHGVGAWVTLRRLDVPGGRPTVRVAHRVCRPSHRLDTLVGRVEYGQLFDSVVRSLVEDGWEGHVERWCGRVGDVGVVDGCVRRACGELPLPTVRGAVDAPPVWLPVLVERVDRHVEIVVVADRHGLGPDAVSALLDDAVPTGEIAAVVDVAYS